MAKLEVFPSDKTRPPGLTLRYGFDRDGLLRYFGGLQRLHELCDVYGVPNPCRTKLHGQLAISGPSLAILLELAERMHKPLDLYQYVRQVR